MSGFSDAQGLQTHRIGKISDLCRTEFGRIMEEAGAENMDVARLGTPEGIAMLRKFLNAVRKKPPQLPHISATMGTDRDIPPEEREAYLQMHARQTLARQRAVADLLFQRLMVDGIEHRIQPEDIEALCAMEKTPRGRSPMLMRQVVIEFLIVLQKERLEAESAHAQGALSLPG